MKCPACVHSKMEYITQDEKLSYGNQSLTLHTMHGEFCPVCGEGVWDTESYRRYAEAQTALLRAVKGLSKEIGVHQFTNQDVTPNLQLLAICQG